MQSGEDEESDKSFEPSLRKLDEARRRGEIAKSNALIAAASYAGLLVVLLIAANASLTGLASGLVWFIEQPDRIAPLVFQGTAASALQEWAIQSTQSLLPWFIIPAAAALAAVLAQRSLVFTPSLLIPRMSRISPLGNAKQKFGRHGLFEFGKSFLKLLIFGLVLWFFLRARLDEMASALWLDPGVTMIILSDLLVAFMTIVVVIAGLLGGADLLWQRAEHLRKNRMSHKEMRDDTKEAEGDPHIKQERRQRGYDLATNRMMLDVPKADVVIVNPTHYAVALKWSRKRGEAPICVAKGVDAVAARIRALAVESGVPLHSDPPAARALYATTEIGSEIASEHYRAVAAAIRFAERIRRKAGARGQ